MRVDLKSSAAFYVSVFLNGVEQRSCVEADTEAGYIKRYVSECGRLRIIDGEAMIETVYGFVEITDKRDEQTTRKA